MATEDPRRVRDAARVVADLSRLLTTRYGHLGGATGVALDPGAPGDALDVLEAATTLLIASKAVFAALEEQVAMEGGGGAMRTEPAERIALGDGEDEGDVRPDDSASNGPLDEPDGAAAAAAAQPPPSAHCPITGDVFRDPVITRYGHSYERAALEAALRADGGEAEWRTSARDPITRRPLRWPGDIVTNRTLRQVVHEMGWSSSATDDPPA